MITYILIWGFGLGGLTDETNVLEWAKELGLVGMGSLPP